MNQIPASKGPEPARLPKDIVTQWPAGLVGNPTALPQCTEQQFAHEEVRNGVGFKHNECPANTAVGVVAVEVNTVTSEVQTLDVPLFNLAPSKGEPARLGFEPQVPVYLNTSVRTGGDYGVTITSNDISELIGFLGIQVTVWGVPGDPRHDAQRGWECLQREVSSCELGEAQPPPFLTMPTSCEAPFSASVSGDSWPSVGQEGEYLPQASAAPLSYALPERVDGCNQLQFEPSISAAPDVPEASAATGLSVDVHVPQKSVLGAEGLAEPAVKDIKVTLPEGVAVNPAGGDGLQACPESLIGYEGSREVDPGVSMATFSPALPDPLEQGVNFCANAAKIGTAEIRTPLLPKPLSGFVYLASQNENPFGSLLALYLVAEDEEAGVLVKLAGEARLSESGQIVTTFDNSPQTPFEDAILHFFGGERAPLTTPARCGRYATTASFTPWSGDEARQAASEFAITNGPHGSPCPGASLPFGPSLTGGTTSNNAGAFSALATTIGREDGNQNMQSVSVRMPPGLSGLLSGVKLCAEAQANAGSCGPESLIGETTVSAGVGSDPVSVTGGRVYITEKYAGAPFGLSIVDPVKAGPFDLEHDTSKPATNVPACDCVVVRARIEVDPLTAALTVTTDPSGPHAIPHLIDGIPVQIRKVNVLIDRPGFTFNPTNCEPMGIAGQITSDEGASSPVSVPFQATNCALLSFKPGFAVATSAHPTRTDGTSLDVKLSYPRAPFGSQANIAKVKVELPKQLPSRLTTLQKACQDSVFNVSPANCPAASRVGEALATTPLVPVPLSGPAYFVSHGGAKFPELIVVLQGYGVTVDLHGETFISKAGVTSSTFNTVPDVPVSSFELKLPAGPYSALTGNGDLCASQLVMPTTFTAQNGAALAQSTPISVQGCTPQIRVIRHSVNGKHATVVVSVPSAGTLVAGGRGISRVVRHLRGRGKVTVRLQLSRADQRFVARHHGRRLMAPISLSFVPAHGKRLSARVAVLMK